MYTFLVISTTFVKNVVNIDIHIYLHLRYPLLCYQWSSWHEVDNSNDYFITRHGFSEQWAELTCCGTVGGHHQLGIEQNYPSCHWFAVTRRRETRAFLELLICGRPANPQHNNYELIMSHCTKRTHCWRIVV